MTRSYSNRGRSAVLTSIALAAATLVVVSDPVAVPARAAAAVSPDTVLVSRGMNGEPSNGVSDRPQISGNGRYVTFDSTATNLVAGGGGPLRRVYRHDLQTGVTELVSLAHDERRATEWSSFSFPNADGSQVAFVSDDQNLVPSGTVSRSVFVRDFNTDTTELVSMNSAGVRANGASSRPMMSSTGRFVAFNSTASNLSPHGSNGRNQVYIRDRETGTTRLVTVGFDGKLGNGENYRGMVSDDGRWVAFSSKSTNLVNDGGAASEAIYLRDMVQGVTIRISKRPNGAPTGGARPYLTPDGQQVVFNSHSGLVQGDTNGFSDVYRYDVPSRQMRRISVTPSGGNLNNDSLRGFITDNHQLAAYNSFAGNTGTNDNPSVGDVFLHDLQTGANHLVSVSYNGGPANGMSYRPVPSGDGSVIVYQSEARNLVPGDESTGEEIYAVTTATILAPTDPPDTVAPVVSISTPANGSTVGSPFAATGTATDDRGVRSAYVEIRNRATGLWLRPDGTWGSSAARLPVAVDPVGGTAVDWSRTFELPAGSYRMNAAALDEAENRSVKPAVLFSVG